MCFKTFIRKLPHNKKLHEKHWFKLWVKESLSIRQLCLFSGHSKNKLERIKDHGLNQAPPKQMDYSKYQHALFDGTYFHKQGCLAVMMDVLTPQLMDDAYVSNERYPNIHPLLLKLKGQGLNLKAVTMDGHRQVTLAFRRVWPEIKIQRCLYHILRQGAFLDPDAPKNRGGSCITHASAWCLSNQHFQRAR